MKNDDAWRIEAALRTKPHAGRPDVATIAATAKDLGIELTRSVYERLASKDRFGVQALPDEIVDFVVSLAVSRRPKTVLQLWASDGKLAQRLASHLGSATITAVEPNAESLAIATFFDGNGTVDWIHGRPRHTDSKPYRSDTDLLIVTGPFGIQGEPIVVHGDGGAEIQLRDDVARLDLVEWSDSVSSDGTALLLTTTSLMWSEAAQKTLAELSRRGLHLNAAIEIPPGTFAPATSIPSTLAVFERHEAPTIFMAELPKDAQAQARLLANMKARTASKSPVNGVLRDRDNLASLESIAAAIEVKKALAATGLALEPLSNIALRFNRPYKIEDGLGFGPADNSLYMPLVGGGPARLEAPPKISKEWIQVELDPTKAVAAYVARWLTSPLGRRVREVPARGITRPRVKASDVENISIPLPPLTDQYASLELDRRLTLLAADIQQLREDLLTKPRRMPEISRAVSKLKSQDDLPAWFESLPLPLSTVGRVYYARKDVNERVEALFHFFEATAEFHAAVLLSGVSADAKFYEQARDSLLGTADQRRKYFEKPTIGGWITMCLTLSKQVKRYLSQSDEQAVGRDAVLRWFGRPDQQWIDAITDSALYDTLDQARQRRNDWKGHGGAVGEAINKSRLAELEQLLAVVRTRMGDGWGDVRLVSPVSSIYQDQVFNTTADVLLGSSLPFLQDVVDTIEPLENDALYLVHAGSLTPMRLLPLVRMMPAPRTATNTCYFYNRVEGGDVRYVSYYYAEDPETLMSAHERASGAVLGALGLERDHD